MKNAIEARHAPRLSDAAVQAKTGKNWQEWFAVLDAAGARAMDHQSIAAHLYQQLRPPPGWWAQMVTVGYEQARGRRQKHQKPSGYEISRSKTFDVPLAKLFAAWQDKRRRDRWLKQAKLVIRKATPNKSLRITWAMARPAWKFSSTSRAIARANSPCSTASSPTRSTPNA